MKIAFDVDVLWKQTHNIRDMVYKVADWGYKYIEQSLTPASTPYSSIRCSPKNAKQSIVRP